MDKFKKLKELYGAGGNFYSGQDLGTHTRAHLGTRGADSNFSRVSQRLYPADALDYRIDKEEEDEEEMSEEREDYVVADSRYKLSEILELLGEAPTIEMLPDPDDMNLFTPQLQTKMLSLAKTQRGFSDYASEVGQEELINFVTKYIPFGDEVLGAFKILKNIIFDINRRANKILAMEDEVNNLLTAMQSNPQNIDAQTLDAIEKIIAEIEGLQSGLYTDYADLGQGLIMLIPEESATIAAPVANTLTQAAEFLAGFGIEKVLRDAVEKSEGRASSDINLMIQADESFSKMRSVIQLLETLQFVSNFSLVFLGPAGWAATALSLLGVDALNPAKVVVKGIKALFVGGLMQNKLIRAVSQVERVGSPTERPSREMYSATEMPPDEDPVGKDSFLRKLFVSYPGDEIRETSFDKSLRTNTLTFLIEEDESIQERPRNVRLRLRGESDPKGFSSGVYEQTLDSRDDEDDESHEDEDIAEFSGAGAVGGVAMKMGHEADGSRTSQEKLKKRYDYFRRSYGSKS